MRWGFLYISCGVHRCGGSGGGGGDGGGGGRDGGSGGGDNCIVYVMCFIVSVRSD